MVVFILNSRLTVWLTSALKSKCWVNGYINLAREQALQCCFPNSWGEKFKWLFFQYFRITWKSASVKQCSKDRQMAVCFFWGGGLFILGIPGFSKCSPTQVRGTGLREPLPREGQCKMHVHTHVSVLQRTYLRREEKGSARNSHYLQTGVSGWKRWWPKSATSTHDFQFLLRGREAFWLLRPLLVFFHLACLADFPICKVLLNFIVGKIFFPPFCVRYVCLHPLFTK